MTEATRAWVEISFNLAYLAAIWGLVAAMFRQQPNLPSERQYLTRPFVGAFSLLALGDTGHVGFRAVAYLIGDLEITLTLLGSKITLVGLGALSTAITVTLFYALMLVVWHRRFDKPYGLLGGFLLAAALVRLGIMGLPQNAWHRTVPPQPWSLYRNLPLMAQGLGVAFLILRDAASADDRTFKWIGVMILISYAFYAPVVFFVQQLPWLGMLMIPKTLAYVAIAGIGYATLFQHRE
jgi:hypothetical protein